MIPSSLVVLGTGLVLWFLVLFLPVRTPVVTWLSAGRFEARWGILVALLGACALAVVDQVSGTSLPLGIVVAALDLGVVLLLVGGVLGVVRYVIRRLDTWEGCVGREATITSQHVTPAWGHAEIVLPGGLPAVVPVRCFDAVPPQRGMQVMVVGRVRDAEALEVVRLVECGEGQAGNE